MRRQRTGFNSPCKILERRWREEQLEKHRRKLELITPTVDSRAPRDYFHLHVKLKKLWLEEQRNEDIQRENARLLSQMDAIMRKGGWTESWNNYESRSLNADKRRREMVDTMQENHRLLQRITQRTPISTTQEWRRYLKPAPRAGNTASISTQGSVLPPHRKPGNRDIKGKAKSRRSSSVSPLENCSSTKNSQVTSTTFSQEKIIPHSSLVDEQQETEIQPEIVISHHAEEGR